MQHKNSYRNISPATDWQILGQLQLPVAYSADDTINEWLMKILNPLNLQSDLLNKILKSAQEAAAHILQAEPVIKLEHIHFIIFVPVNYTSKGHDWGFFRIEKIDSATADKNFPDHAIEFYLYLEG